MRQSGHREQLRFGTCLEAESVLTPEVPDLFDHLALLIDLDRVDARVATLVLVLGDRRLEGVSNIADPVAEDVAESDEHGQLNAAEHQMVGQLLEIDGAGRILRRVDQHVTRRRDGEVSLTPTVDLVEVGGVGGGKNLTRLPAAMAPRRRCIHANMIRQLP